MTILKTAWLFFCVLLNAVSSPYLYHVERFPTLHHLCYTELMHENLKYQEHLHKMLNLYPNQVGILDEMKEAEQIRLAWDALQDAKNDEYPAWRRRKGLQQMLNIIGPEAFMRGEMPMYVPVWRFREVR